MNYYMDLTWEETKNFLFVCQKILINFKNLYLYLKVKSFSLDLFRIKNLNIATRIKAFSIGNI